MSNNHSFFPVWRKIITWGWYRDSNTKSLFLHLLLTCNYQESEYLGHKILPGQCVTGRKKLSEELGMTEQEVRTCLNKLKSTNEVTSTVTNKFTILTLVNYNRYTVSSTNKQPALSMVFGKKHEKSTNNLTNKNNDIIESGIVNNNTVPEKSTNKSTDEQPTINQQATTSNNIISIEYKKRERENVPHEQSAVVEYFKELGVNHLEGEKFYDYYEANGWRIGNKAPIKDWRAAARNWVRRMKPETEADRIRAGVDIMSRLRKGEKV